MEPVLSYFGLYNKFSFICRTLEVSGKKTTDLTATQSSSYYTAFIENGINSSQDKSPISAHSARRAARSKHRAEEAKEEINSRVSRARHWSVHLSALRYVRIQGQLAMQTELAWSCALR